MELVLKNITKSYDKKNIIKDVSFTIGDGECVALIGPNGAGKSTIMKMINGIIEIDSGSIFLNSKDIKENRSEVGYLSQFQSFYEWMTVEETIKFMGGLSGLKDSFIKRKIPELLEHVGLPGKEKEKIRNLSGGMKQRIGIAQAILHEPKLLILDEPVSALDAIGRREVINLILSVKNKMSVLISTHILNDAEEFCDRYLILKDGKLISDIKKVEVLGSKYHKTMSLELINRSTNTVDKIRELQFVEKVIEYNNKLLIDIIDIDNNKYDLINYIFNHRIDYKGIEIYQENLEDMFMNMVVGNE
jgi:ABC-2 type transport system ATP-binding protein